MRLKMPRGGDDKVGQQHFGKVKFCFCIQVPQIKIKGLWVSRLSKWTFLKLKETAASAAMTRYCRVAPPTGDCGAAADCSGLQARRGPTAASRSGSETRARHRPARRAAAILSFHQDREGCGPRYVGPSWEAESLPGPGTEQSTPTYKWVAMSPSDAGINVAGESITMPVLPTATALCKEISCVLEQDRNDEWHNGDCADLAALSARPADTNTNKHRRFRLLLSDH